MSKIKKAVSGTNNREALKPMRDMGVPGYSVISGYIESTERNPSLRGRQKYITASDILSNISIVSSGLFYYLNLASQTAWKIEPAEDNGKDNPPSDESKRVAEFVESTLYDMNQSWGRIVRRTCMYRFYGFGIQEWTAKRRLDGAIGFKSILQRPQSTIERWDIDPDSGNINGVWQTNPNTMRDIYLPRQKVIYIVDDAFTDSPEGYGWVRSLAATAERYQRYQQIEGSGFERDFRGIPIGYAPRAEIMQMVKAGLITEANGQQLLQGLEHLVQARSKGSRTSAVLDSSTYPSMGAEGPSPSNVKKWGIELLTGSATGIEHLGAAIARCNHDMALILGVDGLLTGRDGGNRALSEDKSRHTYLSVNATVADIAEAMESDYCGPLLRLNGIDEKYRPTFKPEKVSFRSVSEVTKSLADMATAGAVLQPDDPVIDDVRDMLGISRAPEMDDDEIAAIKQERLSGSTGKDDEDNGN